MTSNDRVVALRLKALQVLRAETGLRKMRADDFAALTSEVERVGLSDVPGWLGVQVRAAAAELAAAGPAAVGKHLSGKHDQSSHAGGKGSAKNLTLHPGPPLDAEQVALFRGGSAEKYLESDGAGGVRFNAERQALHDQIVTDLTAGKPSQAEPRYVMMGGGPAAGKSSILGKDGVDVPGEADSVHVDSDGIKGKLPEYQAMTAAKDPSAAAFSHEESSFLAKRVQATAFANSQDVVLDGTGDSSPDSVRKKISAARASGYSVEANYVTIDTDEAVARATARAAKTGRVVPETVIRSTHASVSRVFPEIAGDFDSITLFDNNGSTAKLIARGGKGALEILDAPAYAAFLAKAD